MKKNNKKGFTIVELVIVIAVIAILAAVIFFCGRATIRSIRAELRGEATCAGCSGNCHGCGSAGKCSSCSISAEEIKKLMEKN